MGLDIDTACSFTGPGFWMFVRREKKEWRPACRLGRQSNQAREAARPRGSRGSRGSRSDQEGIYDLNMHILLFIIKHLQLSERSDP